MRFYCETCKTVFDIGFPIVKEKGEWKPDYKQEYISGGAVAFDGYCPYHGCLMQVIPDYETPEQYEKRTGKPYPEDGAVWARTVSEDGKGKGNWYCACLGFHDAKNHKFSGTKTEIVCSVTKPPDNWRPE